MEQKLKVELGYVCTVELRATLASDGNLMARVETPL